MEEEEGQQPVKQGEGFKLKLLPVLARSEVIRSMDIKERIKLSLSSRKMEEMIRYTKGKVNKVEFHVNISDSTLKIESLNTFLYYFGPDQRKEGSNYLGGQILSKWIDKNLSSFQNCVLIFKHLQNIFSFNSLNLNVNFEGMTVPFFKEIITEPALKEFEFLSLDKGEIDAECLDLVMETAHSNRDLHIKGTRVPEDYYHENAFKFCNVIYDDAEWVRIENLLSLKNSNQVELGRNELNCSDLNTFIKFWIESDHDMVQCIIFKGVVPTEILYDGIVVLEGRQGICLVAANPTKQRKLQIMGIVRFNELLIFYSFDKDMPFHFEGNLNAESWIPEYKVLMILNKKKELEGELERIQDLLETNQDESMVEKKNEISRELQNVSIELDNHNLVLTDGVYSYR